MKSTKTTKRKRLITVDACSIAYEFNLLRLGIKNRIRRKTKDILKDIPSEKDKDIVDY